MAGNMSQAKKCLEVQTELRVVVVVVVVVVVDSPSLAASNVVT